MTTPIRTRSHPRPAGLLTSRLAARRPLLPSLLLVGLLAACSQPAPPATDAAPPAAAASTSSAPATEPLAPPIPPAACDATKAQWAIGKPLDEVLLERARVDAGATGVRSLKPGQMVTMEFNAERLNVDVDADSNVTGVRCG